MIWSLPLDDFNGTFCHSGRYPLISYMKELLDAGDDIDNIPPPDCTTTCAPPPTTAQPTQAPDNGEENPPDNGENPPDNGGGEPSESNVFRI